MKKAPGIVLTALFFTVTIAVLAFDKATQIKPSANDQGFAVVELFTSEGCSSCPPADEAVAKIQREFNDKPVYILAFHVDYWNRLGWKDVFSDAGYSKRQRDYAGYLKLQSAYTPQIVVNGKKEFVGSEEGTLRNTIKSALKTEPRAQLTFSEIKINQNKANIGYSTEGSIVNTVMVLALIEKSAQTSVNAGENKGRNLAHVQIVRSLQAIALNNSKTGYQVMALPKGFNAEKYEIIGLLQNRITGEIMGAAKASLPLSI